MAWYKTGTVAVTNGSTTVTGTGTNFVSGAQVGEAFQGPDGELYEITAISSATSLTLGSSYGGSTASGQSYAIIPTQSLVADLATDVSTLISDYQDVADNAGEGKFGDGSAAAPGIKFSQDQDTGFFRDTANEIAVSAGGSKIGSFTATGFGLLDSEKITLGTGSDLSIYHNALNSIIEDTGTGSLILRSNSLNIQNAAGTETMAQFIEDGAVSLRYDNEVKLATTANGVNFTAETVSISGTTAGARLQITSSDEGASDGPVLALYRDSSSPAADDDIARVDFLGENASGSQIAYARIDTFIEDPTAGDEKGRIRFLLESEGLQRSFLEMDASAGGAGGRVWVNSPQVDIDFRVSGDTEANLFYVDASTDKIGVGTGTPSSVFHAYTDTDNNYVARFDQDHATGWGVLIDTDATVNTDPALWVKNATDTILWAGSGGSVGISTSSPSSFNQVGADTLVVGSGSGEQGITIYSGAANNGVLAFADGTTTTQQYQGYIGYNHTANYMRFFTSAAEAMRITSGGDLIVGGTSNNPHLNSAGDSTDNAASVDGNGYYSAGRYNGIVGYFNRTGTDGEILRFIKDGTNTVGGIGHNGTIYLAGASSGIRVRANDVIPATSAGAADDNALDLGISTARWKDLYLSGKAIAKHLTYTAGDYAEPEVWKTVKRGATSITFDVVMDEITAWSPGFMYLMVGTTNANATNAYNAWYFIRHRHYSGNLSAAIVDSGGDTSNITVTISDQGGSDPITMRISITGLGAYGIATLEVSNYYGIASVT